MQFSTRKTAKTTVAQKKRVAIAGVVSIILVSAPRAEGSTFMDLFAGPLDLLRANSERTVIFFGNDVKFKKYRLVTVLNRYATVLTDDHKKDFSLETREGERVLTIY